MNFAILVHGFNVSKPERTVGKLEPFFKAQGFDVELFRYGHIGLWGVRKRNKALARKLAQKVNAAKAKGYTVYVVSHSNGTTITHIASVRYKAQVDVAICINPALKKTLNPCPTAELVHVYHNEKDVPVRLAKWLRRLTPLSRRARPWGEMGREGYQGDNMRVWNFDTLNDFEIPASGHSGVFKEPEINYYGTLIPQAAVSDYRQVMSTNE